MMNAVTSAPPTLLINEFLSGLTIALLLIPEYIAANTIIMDANIIRRHTIK